MPPVVPVVPAVHDTQSPVPGGSGVLFPHAPTANASPKFAAFDADKSGHSRSDAEGPATNGPVACPLVTESAEIAQAVAWHRQVAALVAAADRAGLAPAQLPAVRARLQAQQQRLAETGQGITGPTPSEIAVAGNQLGDLTEGAVNGAIRTAWATLDAVDASLGLTPSPPALAPAHAPATATATATARPGPPVAVRNAAVYGGFATIVSAVQIALFVLLDDSTLALSAPFCLLVLPAFAWLAGFLTIGVVFRPAPPARSVRRSPRLGAIVCLVPNVLLCGVVGVLFVANR